MSAITAKASRKMKKYAVLTREPRCFLGSFDFSWEQRKLGEMGQTYTGLSGKTKDDFGHGQARFVTYMNVFSNPISNPEMTEPIEIDPKQNEVEVGDVFFTTSSETPKEVGMSSILLEKRGKTYLNSFCFGFRPSEKIDSYYLAYMLRSESTRAKIILLAQGISRYNISKNKVMEIAVSLPSLDEQKMIGQYFSQLDNLITLHQRKCVFLFGFFQAFISMIFTASTFSWEQRKFSDITFPAGEKNKDNLPLESYSITNEHGFVPQDEKFENGGTMREADKRMYYIVSPNSFAYNPARINVGSIGYQNIGKNVIVSSLYEVFKTSEDVDDRLLWHWFKSSDFQKLIMQLQEGGVRLYFYYDKLCMGEVSLPSLDEQRKIGKLFDTLDNLITLHQRECISFTARAGRLILTANKKRNTSSWEQRKLSEMCGTFEYGLNAAAKEFDGKNKYIRITDIDDASREFLLSDLSSPDICLDGMSKYLLSSGDIVFARTGASVGKTYIYRENDGIVYFAGFLIRAKVNQDNDAEFVFQSTLSPSYEKYIRITSQRSGQPGVNAQEYGEYDLFAPSKEEQQRIGHFLRGIDNLITLHQRKPFLMKWRTSDANRNQTNRLVL